MNASIGPVLKKKEHSFFRSLSFRLCSLPTTRRITPPPPPPTVRSSDIPHDHGSYQVHGTKGWQPILILLHWAQVNLLSLNPAPSPSSLSSSSLSSKLFSPRSPRKPPPSVASIPDLIITNTLLQIFLPFPISVSHVFIKPAKGS